MPIGMPLCVSIVGHLRKPGVVRLSSPQPLLNARSTLRPVFPYLAAQGGGGETSSQVTEFEEGVWFQREPCTEVALFSDRYDFTISLLHLGAAPSRYVEDDDDGGLDELRELDWS